MLACCMSDARANHMELLKLNSSVPRMLNREKGERRERTNSIRPTPKVATDIQIHTYKEGKLLLIFIASLIPRLILIYPFVASCTETVTLVPK